MLKSGWSGALESVVHERNVELSHGSDPSLICPRRSNLLLETGELASVLVVIQIEKRFTSTLGGTANF